METLRLAIPPLPAHWAALVIAHQRMDVSDDVAGAEHDGPDQSDGEIRHGHAPRF